MSRGLGHAQREVLAILSDRPRGATVPELSALIDVSPRHGRAIVASLVARSLVEVNSTGTVRRIQLPEQRLAELRRVQFDRDADNAYAVEILRRAAATGAGAPATLACPDCGCRFTLSLSVPRDESKYRAAAR